MWALEENCPTDEKLSFAVAQEGDLEKLQTLQRHGVPFDSRVPAMVFESFRLDEVIPTLRWLREKGCPWDGFTMLMAVSSFKLLGCSPSKCLELVKFLESSDPGFWHGFYLDEDVKPKLRDDSCFEIMGWEFWESSHVVDWAIEHSTVAVVEFLVSKGGDRFSDERGVAAAARAGNRSMLGWLLRQGGRVTRLALTAVAGYFCGDEDEPTRNFCPERFRDSLQAT